MTNFRTVFGIITILSLLVSCSGEQTDNNKPTKHEIPKALQDGKLEMKSYSRSDDLIEELYQELVSKTPGLKKLEDDLDAFNPKTNDLTDKFSQYDNKSNSYYSSANNKATAITDSLLRVKMLSLIASSGKQYTNKTAELSTLLKNISKNSITLNDHHNVLKIVLTLPLIEKYQVDSKPDVKEFHNLAKEQGQLILLTDGLIPKY